MENENIIAENRPKALVAQEVKPNELTVVDPQTLEPKEWKALDMTFAGATLQEIATALGYQSRSGALSCQRRALKKYSTAIGDDRVEWYSRIVGSLLFKQEKLAEAVKAGDVEAINMSHKIDRTLISIHGLKAPEKFEGRIGIAIVDATDAERLEQIFTLLTSSDQGDAGQGAERPDDPTTLDPTP